MKTHIFIIQLIGLALMTQSTAALGAEVDDGIKLIQSTNRLDRVRAVRILIQEREEAIKGLIGTLDDQSTLEVKLDAARALGKYRAPEAAEALVKNLWLESQEHQLVGGLLTDEDHEALIQPISAALEKIGNPSIPPVIKNLAESDDAKVWRLSLRVLVRIDGDKDITQLRLQKALKAETDPQKQARLRAALKALAEIPNQ